MAVIPLLIEDLAKRGFTDPHESINGRFFGATAPFFALMVIAYCLRIYSRLGHLSWDDFFISIATILEIVSYALSIKVFVDTGGRHIFFVPPALISRGLKYGFAVFLLVAYVNLLVKVSVACMILRIKSTKPWRIAFWFLIASCVIIGISSTATALLQCTPISTFWNIQARLSKPDACWSPTRIVNLNYMYGAYFALTDLIIALIPIAFIRHIKRPLRDRIILSLLLGAGILAMAVGIVKTILFKHFTTSPDVFYKLGGLGPWLHLELMIGIIAACIPCLKSLFERFMKRAGVHLTTASRSGMQRRGGGGLTYEMKTNEKRSLTGSAHRLHDDEVEESAWEAQPQSVSTVSSPSRSTEKKPRGFIDNAGKGQITVQDEIYWESKAKAFGGT